MKAFYTDPQAADWMRLKYAMDFVSSKGDDISIIDGVFINDETGNVSDKAYVHADSIPLLLPKEFDTLQIGDGHPAVCAYCVLLDIFPNGEERGEFLKKLRRRDFQVRIIQRNGIMFHWPEFEA